MGEVWAGGVQPVGGGFMPSTGCARPVHTVPRSGIVHGWERVRFRAERVSACEDSPASRKTSARSRVRELPRAGRAVWQARMQTAASGGIAVAVGGWGRAEARKGHSEPLRGS